MTGTNPGTWPDHEPNEPKMNQYIDDGKREAFAELDKTIPLYTTADLKAARLETVERFMNVVIEAMQKIREEINEG